MKTIRPLIISIIRKNSIIKKTNSQKEHTIKQTKRQSNIFALDFFLKNQIDAMKITIKENHFFFKRIIKINQSLKNMKF